MDMAQPAHYSQYTVFICKKTFIAHILLKYHPEDNTYEFTEMLASAPGWLSVHSSLHRIEFPNTQFHILGHAFQPFIINKLRPEQRHLDLVYMLSPHHRPNLETFHTASTPCTQEIPFNTVIVSKITFQAYRVAAFDPSDYDGPYSLIQQHG